MQQIPSSDVGAGISWLRANAASLIKQGYIQLHNTQCDWDKYRGKDRLSREEFKALLESIDKAYVAPYATAQVARQAGTYLGLALNQQSEIAVSSVLSSEDHTCRVAPSRYVQTKSLPTLFLVSSANCPVRPHHLRCLIVSGWRKGRS